MKREWRAIRKTAESTNANTCEVWRTPDRDGSRLSWAISGWRYSEGLKEPSLWAWGYEVCLRFPHSRVSTRTTETVTVSLSLWHWGVHCWLSSGSRSNRGALDDSSGPEPAPARTLPEAWALANCYAFQSLSFPIHKMAIILISTSLIQITHTEFLREYLTHSKNVTPVGFIVAAVTLNLRKLQSNSSMVRHWPEWESGRVQPACSLLCPLLAPGHLLSVSRIFYRHWIYSSKV